MHQPKSRSCRGTCWEKMILYWKCQEPPTMLSCAPNPWFWSRAASSDASLLSLLSSSGALPSVPKAQWLQVDLVFNRCRICLPLFAKIRCFLLILPSCSHVSECLSTFKQDGKCSLVGRIKNLAHPVSPHYEPSSHSLKCPLGKLAFAYLAPRLPI